MKTLLLLIVVTLAFTVSSHAQDYFAIQKQKDRDRAVFWAGKGYRFDPTYMTAYSMDQKVKDIDRASFWKEKGYSFNPDYMTAYSMDQKVKDIERAKYWRERGHNFDPEYMTAYAMDYAVSAGANSQTPAVSNPSVSRGYRPIKPSVPLVGAKANGYRGTSDENSVLATTPSFPSISTPAPVIPKRTLVPGYTGSRYDPNSLANPYGAGSPYKSDGLMNPYSQYGSRYSNKSWTNPYATDAPKLYDSQGNYRGRLSTNRYDPESTSNPYGRYGSKYSSESINNPYGAGNPYSSDPIYVVPSQD